MGHSNRCEVYLTVVLIWISLTTNDIVHLSERITSRKARGLQTEEIGLKCQTIFLSLKLQEETNYKCHIFSCKILCCQDTWFHLNLTCLKP